MIQEIKIYSGIAAKSVVKWLLLFGIGLLVSLVLFIVALVQNWNPPGQHSYFYNLLYSNWAAFLLIIGLPLFVFLYVIIANKYSTQTVIFLIWKNKAGDFAAEKIKLLVDKIVDKNKNAAMVTNETVLKIQLLEANRTHPDSSKIKRKAVDYFIKKIRLDDIDYSNKQLRLGDIVATKVTNYVTEITEPSLRLFWIILVLHLVLFVLSQIL